MPSRMPKWKFLSTHGGEPISSKPQFQLAASLSVVSEAPGRGILPGVSRYTAALPVLYRLSRPFTQDPFSPTRTMSASNCSDGSNSRPQLFMEPFVSGFTRESRVPRHEKRKGPDLTRRFHDAYTSQACSDLCHSARHGENQVSLCDGKDRGHKVWQSKRHTPLYAKLRQSAIHQSLLPLPYVDLDVLKFQVLFQRKTTSTNPQSRAYETNKIKGKEHFGL